jgi:hypothetical protein
LSKKVKKLQERSCQKQDYRYYEGDIKGDEFYLSAFSGSSPALIIGKIEGNTITGQSIGATSARPLKGTKNDQIELPDAYSLTKVKDGKQFDFTFQMLLQGKIPH